MFGRMVFACVLLLGTAGGLRGEDPRWRAAGEHVLVVYAADAADGDGNGRSDSQDAAEYYAARRGVPAGNLLGVKLGGNVTGREHCTYRQFFEGILQPVAAKLSSKAADGQPYSQRICYILVCPGTPIRMTTHPKAAKGEKSWARRATTRSVDGYLISVAANLAAGVDAESGLPGAGQSGPIGAEFREVMLPIFGAYANGVRARHFRQFRRLYPQQMDFYLVSRLGLDLQTARDMLDGALYAERYLRLPGPDEKAAFRPEIWLDQKHGFAQDHVASMAQAVAVVQGVPGSPFAAGKGLLRVWPLVIDNQSLEVGAVVKKTQPASTTTAASSPASPAGVQHKPTVSARIAGNGVDAEGVTLVAAARIGRLGRDVAPALYFRLGCKVSNGKATATVTGRDVEANRLLLDSTEGFAGGDTIKSIWPGEFPTSDCFVFYGFYGLGRYEDVFQFPPGALGIHVDSSCMNWARGAMGRGIAATFGVIGEPLSLGIPHGHQALLALSAGYDWAEAAYGGLRLAQRWRGVVFGDPLYAPFRSRQLTDRTPPAISAATVKVSGKTVTIAAQLVGKTPDELADVALFKLEYGPTEKYGKTVEFFDWPDPQNSARVQGRRFGYSRHFRWALQGLQKGKTYHFRLTARDPAGLETTTADATFEP